MTEHEAVVTRVDGAFAVLEPASTPSCGSCAGKSGCGTASAVQRSYAIRNTIGARPGDKVVVSVPDGAVFKAAALSYLMPLVFVIAGAAVGGELGGEGLPAVAGAALGLAAGLAALRIASVSWRGREPGLALKCEERLISIDNKET